MITKCLLVPMPKYLENDYMNNFTPRTRVILTEMNEPVIDQLMDETRDDMVVLSPHDTTYEMTSTLEPHRSGRSVRPPIRFTLLGETFEAISEGPESNPYTYDEAIKDIDAYHWVKATNSELDSMYSNQVWDLVEVPNSIKPVVCK